MEKIKCSQFVTLDKQIIEPGIMNQTGEISACLYLFSALTESDKPFAIIPIELPKQDCPIRGITITYNY